MMQQVIALQHIKMLAMVTLSYWLTKELSSLPRVSNKTTHLAHSRFSSYKVLRGLVQMHRIQQRQ